MFQILIIIKIIKPAYFEFADIKTVDKRIKYAKDVPKIRVVDFNFSLDAINYVNKMLVDVSNAHKGKFFMPTRLRYLETKAYKIRRIW